MKMIQRWSVVVLSIVAIGAGFGAGAILRNNNEATEAIDGGVPVTIDVQKKDPGPNPPDPDPDPEPEPEPEPEPKPEPKPDPEPEPEWPTPIPKPPVDLCPNLPGNQSTVPGGYYLDIEANACLPAVPPTADEDVCLNIPGVQIETPDGMINDDGYCYEPSVPIIPPTSEGTLKNVPDWLQPFAQFLVNLVPEPVKEFFRSLPEEVVGQIPIYVFVLVFILILIPIIQAIREYYYRRRLMMFYRRERALAEEKDNFITIASHYLRTPIAIMRDTIPLMLGAGVVMPDRVAPMNTALQTLGDQVSRGIEAANADSALESESEIFATKPKSFWRSGFFWLPIILSILLTLAVNFFIGVVGDKEIGMGNVMLQFFIVVAFIVGLYLVVRNYHIQKKLRQDEDALIAREQRIDAVRNNFLEQQVANISAALGVLYFSSPHTPPHRSYMLYADGMGRLSGIHDKFILLSQIKTGANRSTTRFGLRSVVDRAIENEQQRIVEKGLQVEAHVGNVAISQNESLFSFVIASVLDNAIKFTGQGGRIVIAADPSDKNITVRVSDNGRGIDSAKIDQLFKPFSRAESAVDFAYEGLGLSLFLDRLILTYTGGDIAIAAGDEGGTDVTITTPLG